MQIIENLESFKAPPEPIALTIGSFDGIHLGHQALLRQLQAGGFPVAITFSNHPAEILRPEMAPAKLCSLEQKLKLLEQAGVKVTILLPFTLAFSQQTAEEFIRKVRQTIPFELLILGADATLGKERQGERARMLQLAQELHFRAEYLDLLTFEGLKVSSSTIRQEIQKGNLTQAEKLLGRPYSLYSRVQTGAGLGKKIGFPTLNIAVQSLCLPPLGVYAVRLKAQEIVWKGVANLGIAPTVRTTSTPILEVHLFDYDSSIQDQSFVEVFFLRYLRPEKKFDNLEQLKAQIALDVRQAKE